MDETINRLNRKRLTCLAYLAPALVLFCLAAVSLFFAVSPSVHLDFAIPFVFFVFFSAVFVRAVKMYKKKRIEYEKDFRENAVPEAFKDEFPEGVFGGERPSASDLAAAKMLAAAERAVFSENLEAVYDGIPFAFSHVEAENIFSGMFFIFTYDAEFRKYVQVRQKGFVNAIKPQSIPSDLPLEKYATGNILFDNAFTAIASSPEMGRTVLTEPVLQSFLKIKENTAAKISAALSGDKLYVLLQSYGREIHIPLFDKIKKERLKDDALSEIRLVLSMAAELKLEKRIWKKHGFV